MMEDANQEQFMRVGVEGGRQTSGANGING